MSVSTPLPLGVPRRRRLRRPALRSVTINKNALRANPQGIVAAPRKPGSVARFGHPRRAGGHSSRAPVTERLQQPTQGLGRTTLERPSTWPCSGWGLPCHNRYRLRGGLLLHLFTLTRGAEAARAVSFSVALSSRFPSPGVTRHPALRSPDFPRKFRLRELSRSPEMLRRAELRCSRHPTQGACRGRGYCAANTNGTLTVVVSPEGGNCQPRTRLEMHCERPR